MRKHPDLLPQKSGGESLRFPEKPRIVSPVGDEIVEGEQVPVLPLARLFGERKQNLVHRRLKIIAQHEKPHAMRIPGVTEALFVEKIWHACRSGAGEPFPGGVNPLARQVSDDDSETVARIVAQLDPGPTNAQVFQNQRFRPGFQPFKAGRDLLRRQRFDGDRLAGDPDAVFGSGDLNVFLRRPEGLCDKLQGAALVQVDLCQPKIMKISAGLPGCFEGGSLFDQKIGGDLLDFHMTGSLSGEPLACNQNSRRRSTGGCATLGAHNPKHTVRFLSDA